MLCYIVFLVGIAALYIYDYAALPTLPALRDSYFPVVQYIASLQPYAPSYTYHTPTVSPQVYLS